MTTVVRREAILAQGAPHHSQVVTLARPSRYALFYFNPCVFRWAGRSGANGTRSGGYGRMNGGTPLLMSGWPRGSGTHGSWWTLLRRSGGGVSFSLELDLVLNPLRQLKTEAPGQGAVAKTFWRAVRRCVTCVADRCRVCPPFLRRYDFLRSTAWSTPLSPARFSTRFVSTRSSPKVGEKVRTRGTEWGTKVGPLKVDMLESHGLCSRVDR